MVVPDLIGILHSVFRVVPDLIGILHSQDDANKKD
jgi:hypothetical protein